MNADKDSDERRREIERHMKAEGVSEATIQRILRPLRNFRQIGPLTDEPCTSFGLTEKWWSDFGAKLEAAQREWDGRK